ncbi:MAG TPA: DEAD/DEAH box helicase family protein [Nitrosarchaeum sp.]|nr:DEAD/DEAH box helicase family protein [Nitrosarchaeum sp.]
MTFFLHQKYLTDELDSLIQDKLILKPDKGLYTTGSEDLVLYHTDDDGVNIPLGLRKDVEKLLNKKVAMIEQYDKVKITLTQPLKNEKDKDQVVLCKEALNILQKDRYCMLAPYPGYGKTVCSTYLATKLGCKILVICFIVEVRKKWLQYFQTHTNAKVQILTSKNLDTKNDTFICGPKACASNIEYLSHIGTVIVDECQRGTEAIFSILTEIRCKYLIGLSGTPDRKGRLDNVFPAFFGNNIIHRFEKKHFTVIKYNTKYIPTKEQSYFRGRMALNWPKLLKSLCLNDERNDEIVKLCIKHAKDVIIVFCYFVKQCDYIYQQLFEQEENVVKLNGSETIGNKEYRILVTTPGKCGIGYDDPRLTMMVMTFSVRDIRQLETRVRRENCTIFDFVDNDVTLENHWKIREKWFKKRGANIITRGKSHIISNEMPPKEFFSSHL